MIEILAVPFELLGVIEGDPTTFRASDGKEVVLCSDGPQNRPSPMSVDRTITVSSTALRSAAFGFRVTVKVRSGRKAYLLRRPTIAEFRDTVTKAHDELRASGGTPPPMPTDAEIERIVYGL